MSRTSLTTAILIIILAVVSYSLYKRSTSGLEDFDLKTEPDQSQVVDKIESGDDNQNDAMNGDNQANLGNEQTDSVDVISGVVARADISNIRISDGVKHLINLEEILGGGPGKDGIPAIDDPKFISVKEASKVLGDRDVGIAVSLNGVNRFYPNQILVWHEIVNDTIQGKRVLVTYCPLCATGIVFDPVVGGEQVEFGVSGQLWNSNLLMYDRKTDSLWSQVLGQAVVGESTGQTLEIIPSDVALFGGWKKANPNGEVLSRDTGQARSYGRDPYGDYYTTPGTIFPVNFTDDRLEDKDIVLGIVVNGKSKAYSTSAIAKAGQVEDVFQGKNIVLQYDSSTDAVRMFEKINDELIRINPIYGFWFSWVAVHPETELLK